MDVFAQAPGQGANFHDHFLVYAVSEEEVLFVVETGLVRGVLVEPPLLVATRLEHCVHATDELVEHSVKEDVKLES